jgi:E3 ubiquitin-protein ligase RAD18
MNLNELNSVTEPHDFSNQYLVSLDTSLRCSICKDLINVPMFAPCSHSFCSMVIFQINPNRSRLTHSHQCIRESLLVNPTCPVCRAAISDGQLKRNTMLSEIVEAYKLSRSVPRLLKRSLLTLCHRDVLLKHEKIQSKSSFLGKRKRSDASLDDMDTPKNARMNLDTRNSSGLLSRNNSHNDIQGTKTTLEGVL